MSEKREIMTMTEVCSYLKVHPSTIYRLLKKKELPAFRVGADWRFTRASIDRWRLDRPIASAATKNRRGTD